MISINKELKEVNINFWGLYDLAFLFKSVYVAILICKKTKKICVLYLYSKDEFVNTFQIVKWKLFMQMVGEYLYLSNLKTSVRKKVLFLNI